MQSPQDPPHLKAWWEEAAAKISKQEKRGFNGMVIYTLWNLWKERIEESSKMSKNQHGRSPLESKRILLKKRGH
jgi:hypothetical protein